MRIILTAGLGLVGAACGMSEGGGKLSRASQEVSVVSDRLSSPPGTSYADRVAACDDDPRVDLNLVSNEACVGADLFFNETFEGNGRTCGTCHAAENNFTLDAKFIADLDPADPLFVANNDPALATLERPALLSEFGLILENVDGLSDLTNRFTLRSVPHMLSLATSLNPATNDGTTIPPNERTGWSGDGAPGNGELRDFTAGAITQHFPKDLSRTPGYSFRLPTSDEAAAVLTFSLGLGRTNELDLNTVTLTDAGAEAGRVAFMGPGKCNGCHRNAGANNPGGFNKNFNTGVERLRIPEVNAATTPGDGGFGGGDLSSPNFDCNGDSTDDCFGNGTFNTPPLIEAADTGPFFHTNAFDTLESSIAFYNTVAFNTAPNGNGIALSGVEVSRIGRFLRVINASLNLQIAEQRLRAVRKIANRKGNDHLPIQKKLIRLARTELKDARRVLRKAPQDLHSGIVDELELRRDALTALLDETDSETRKVEARREANALELIYGDLGTNITYVLGEGNLLF